MRYESNKKIFGFWKGMPTSNPTDSFDEFKAYKNTIPKECVVKHIESLEAGISSVYAPDLFTGEEYRFGIYDDGDFIFPTDFLRYYKRYDIGIPYEYEEYLKTILDVD